MIPPNLLLKAYAEGIFPMAMENGEIAWFSPTKRGVIPLDAFHIPHGLKRTLKRSPFEVRFNHDFSGVMRACADRSETWINEDILESYTQLHGLGYAHSVECWSGDECVGGLYGVSLGGAFFGESMFHRSTDASKVALVYLVDRLISRGFTLLDTQWTTPHLEQFGAKEISRKEYQRQLGKALQRDASFV